MGCLISVIPPLGTTGSLIATVRPVASLDALNPNVLRGLVEDAIVARLDREAWDRAEAIQAVEMSSIADFIRSYPGTALG